MAVERYIYFPASRRQFGSKSKALLELRRDETPQSGMLMTVLNVLLRTHRQTFAVLRECGGVETAGYSSAAQPPWDVRQVLQEERKQVGVPLTLTVQPNHLNVGITSGFLAAAPCLGFFQINLQSYFCLFAFAFLLDCTFAHSSGQEHVLSNTAHPLFTASFLQTEPVEERVALRGIDACHMHSL